MRLNPSRGIDIVIWAQGKGEPAVIVAAWTLVSTTLIVAGATKLFAGVDSRSLTGALLRTFARNSRLRFETWSSVIGTAEVVVGVLVWMPRHVAPTARLLALSLLACFLGLRHDRSSYQGCGCAGARAPRQLRRWLEGSVGPMLAFAAAVLACTLEVGPMVTLAGSIVGYLIGRGASHVATTPPRGQREDLEASAKGSGGIEVGRRTLLRGALGLWGLGLFGSTLLGARRVAALASGGSEAVHGGVWKWVESTSAPTVVPLDSAGSAVTVMNAVEPLLPSHSSRPIRAIVPWKGGAYITEVFSVGVGDSYGLVLYVVGADGVPQRLLTGRSSRSEGLLTAEFEDASGIVIQTTTMRSNDECDEYCDNVKFLASAGAVVICAGSMLPCPVLPPLCPVGAANCGVAAGGATAIGSMICDNCNKVDPPEPGQCYCFCPDAHPPCPSNCESPCGCCPSPEPAPDGS